MLYECVLILNFPCSHYSAQRLEKLSSKIGKRKNKLNELYRKAQSSMCTDKKVKIQDSKA